MLAAKQRLSEQVFVVTIMVVALVAFQLVVSSVAGGSGDSVRDTDPYMWLARARYLYETGDWFQANYPRINPPIGYEQHWTRLFDLVLISGGLVGSLFVSFETALYQWALYLGLLFQILTLFALLWALAPWYRSYGGSRSVGVLSALFILQAGILVTFQVGRPDHQILIFFFSVLLMGFTIRMLFFPFRRSWCYGAGLVAALGVWVSVEFVPAVLISLACLFIFALLGKPQFSRKLYHYSVSFFGLSVLALISQKGFAGSTVPATDQISIIYITLFASIFLLSLYLYVSDLRYDPSLNTGSPVFIVIIGGISTLVLLGLLYPDLWYGPFGHLDEVYARTHFPRIAEIQPIVSLQALRQDWVGQVSRLFIWVGIALPAIPVLIVRLARSRDAEFKFWLYLTLASLFYVPIALLQIRWVPYAVLFLLPAYAWLINRVLSTHRWPEGLAGSLGRVILLAVLLLWFYLPALVSPPQEKRASAMSSCSVPALSQHLNHVDTWVERPKNLLAFIDLGPALLWYTPHFVYSIPSHRYHSGFTDSYNVMAAADDAAALNIVRERNVELILICKAGPEGKFHSRKDGKETFHDRLAKGQSPEWLQPVSLPSELSATFNLYQVISANAAKAPDPLL